MIGFPCESLRLLVVNERSAIQSTTAFKVLLELVKVPQVNHLQVF